MQIPKVTARSFSLILWLLSTLPAMQTAYADADIADSLDFEAFHKYKSDARKPGKREKNNREEDNPFGPSYQVGAPYTTDVDSFAKVVSTLVSDMDMQCSAGWEKLREWSSRKSNSRYLYFKFRCL